VYSEVPLVPEWVIIVCQVTLGIAMLLSLWRVARGPTVMDRIVALDLIAALIMGQLVTMVLASGFISYLDAASAIAVISFIATVALARYLESQKGPDS